MSFFHLRTLPGNAWPALPDAALAQVWDAYLELDRNQWLEPGEIERCQLQQVRTLLAHCITNVPYYRRVLSEAGMVPGAIQSMDDFRRLPRLCRQTVQESREALTAQSLPLGTTAASQAQTSGTSGRPVTVLQTNMTGLWWFACYLRDLEWCAPDPTGTIAVIKATGKTGPELARLLEGISMPSWQPALQGLIEMGPMYAMDVHQDPRRQLEWLRRLAPDYLLTTAGNLAMLAGLVGEHGRLPSLRAIQAIAETLTPQMHALVEDAFGVPVKNTYSCCEAGYLASPCPEGHGLHVHAENVLLEILDEAGQPVQPGGAGRVVITSLNNFRSPFVRYEIGDDATAGPLSCPCGRGLQLLASVEGKTRPMFLLNGGRCKSSSPLAIVLSKIGGHWQHQVIQKTCNHVVVRLAVDSTWTEEHAARLRKMLEEFFEAPIQIDLEIKDRLELTTGGKLRSIICELNPDPQE